MRKIELITLIQESEKKLNYIAQIIIGNAFSNKTKKDAMIFVIDSMDLLDSLIEQAGYTSARIKYDPFNERNKVIQDKSLLNNKHLNNVEFKIIEATGQLKKMLVFNDLYIFNDETSTKYIPTDDFRDTFHNIKTNICDIERSLRLTDDEPVEGSDLTPVTEDDKTEKKSFISKVISYIKE